MQQQQIDDVIKRCLANLGQTLGAGKPFVSESGAVCLSKDGIMACLRGALYAHEVEFSIIIDRGSIWEKYSSDVIQTWLDKPVQAIQFSGNNLEIVVKMAVDIIHVSLVLLLERPEESLLGLEKAREKLLDKSNLEWLRTEAVEAMKRGDITRLLEVDAEDSRVLTPAERKKYIRL